MKKLFKEFTAAQLAKLKKEYEPLRGKRLHMYQIDKMKTMLSKHSTDMLVKLANTDIPFLATAAKSIAVMKRGKKWSDFKTKLDMSEADELQCEACWDSHKQVGFKMKNGKRVPNCVPKEELQEVLDLEEASMKRLLQAIQDKLSDEGGAAGFDDLKKTAKSMGVTLTQNMLKDMPGVKQHRDGDYILENKSSELINLYQIKNKTPEIEARIAKLEKELKVIKREETELEEADLSKSQVKMVHKTADKMPKKDFMKRYGKDGDSVRYATATNMVKKKLGIGEEELEENLNFPFTKRDFKKLESDNQHGEAAEKLVQKFGTREERNIIAVINIRHHKRGYITNSDFKERTRIVNKYYNKLKEQRAHTSPEVAAALRQYVAQRPMMWRGEVGKADKKDFEELMRLALRDMKAFNKKLDGMDTDPRDGVYQALRNKGLSSHITIYDETKPRGDQEMNESYKDKFNATMKKFGINSLDDLKSDAEKKKFFKAVDNAHDAKNEELDEMKYEMTKEMMDEMMKEMMKEMSNKIEMLKAEKDPTKCEMMKKEMMKEMVNMNAMKKMPEMMKKEMMKEIMKKMDEYGNMNAMKKESIDEKHKPGHNEMMKKETAKKEMAMNAMKKNAGKMPIRAMMKKELKTGDDDLTPTNNMKLNAMVKEPHKPHKGNPIDDMNAGYMKSDVRADVKNGGGADMAKVKDAPKMQAAMKKINAMYKTEKYHDTKPGSIQETIAKMFQAEDKEVTVEDKKLDNMIKQYLAKGGTITKLPPALQKGAKPSDMQKHKIGDKGVVKSMYKMKEVREFITTYNSHFLTNFKAEELILKDRLEG